MAASKKGDRTTAVTLLHNGVVYPAGTSEADIEDVESITAPDAFEG